MQDDTGNVMEPGVKSDAVVEVSELDGQKGALPPQPVLNPAYCTPYYQCTALTNPPCDESLLHDQLTHQPVERKVSDVPFSAPSTSLQVAQPETSLAQSASDSNRLVEQITTLFQPTNQIPQNYQQGEQIIPQYQVSDPQPQQPVVNYNPSEQNINFQYQTKEQQPPISQVLETPAPTFQTREQPLTYPNTDQVVQQPQAQTSTNTTPPANYQPHQLTTHFTNQTDQLPSPYQPRDQVSQYYQQPEQHFPQQFQEQVPTIYQSREQKIQNFQVEHQIPSYQSQEVILPQYQPVPQTISHSQIPEQPNTKYQTQEQIVPPVYQLPDPIPTQYNSQEQHTSQQLPIINQITHNQPPLTAHQASDQPHQAEHSSAHFEPIHAEVPQACTLDLQALLSAPHSPQVTDQQRKMSCEDHQCLKDCQCQLLLVDNNAGDSGVDASEHDQLESNETEQVCMPLLG